MLGISSGAKLAVALLMIWLLSHSINTGSAGMILAAFAGSMISMGFVLLVAKKVRNMSMLVVSGVMIGYICSAVTDFVVTFADDSNIVNLHNWSQGSFSGMSWSNVRVMAVVVAAAMIVTIFMAKPIRAYQLGEAYAQNMGVNIRLFRVGLIQYQRAVCLCDGLCWADFLCGNCSSSHCEKYAENLQAASGDSGLFFRRSGFLPAV